MWQIAGDDTAYGQALFPVPAEDPNDPLQVRPPQTGKSLHANGSFAVVELQENHDSDCGIVLLVPRKCGPRRTWSLHHNLGKGISDITNRGFRTNIIFESGVRFW